MKTFVKPTFQSFPFKTWFLNWVAFEAFKIIQQSLQQSLQQSFILIKPVPESFHI